jgi:hypothetical protein
MKRFPFFWLMGWLLLASTACQTTQPIASFQGPEGLYLYDDGDQYIVAGAHSRQVKGRYADAPTALEAAMTLLPKGGGEIQFGPGTYPFGRAVRLRSYLRLRGQGTGTRLLWEQGATGAALLIADEVNQTRIEDLAVVARHPSDSLTAGILLRNCGECVVEDVSVMGAFDHGITLDRDVFLSKLTGCHLGGMRGSGIFLDSLNHSGRGGDFLPNIISECVIFDCEYGIEGNNAIVVNILGCAIFQTRSHGFYLHNISHSILISGCRTFQLGGDAVHLNQAWETNLNGNIFCWHEGHGIVLDNVTWGTISGNNIIDNGSMNLYPLVDSSTVPKYPDADIWLAIPHGDTLFPDKAGIFMANNTRGITITSNAIWNWPLLPPMTYGIEADSSCNHNIVSLNTIDFARDGGILMPGPDNLVRDNMEHLGRNYVAPGSDKWQSFDLRLMRDYQRELMSMLQAEEGE